MPTKQTTWKADTKRTPRPPLTESIETDIAIIGAGITGITAAYLLAKAGKSVVVLEKDTVGEWATGMTTAIITKSIDTDTKDLILTMGKENAKRVLDSHQAAIDAIAKIVEDKAIDCEFMLDENQVYANTTDDLKAIKEEADALEELGIKASYSETPIEGFENAGYLALPGQAKFHPLKYLYALADAAESAGARIYEHTEVKKVSGKNPFILETPSGNVVAKQVIAATYMPFHQPPSLFFLKANYRTYMLEAEIPQGLIPEGTYEDTDNPYHYFRVDAGEEKDRMIIGGEDHRNDLKVSEDKSYAALEDYLKKLIPGVDYTVVRKWSGLIVEPVDGLAYIGALHENFFFATAFSGTGMTYGTLAAMIISDEIAGRKNEYADLYAISRGLSLRRTAVKAVDYIEELFGGAVANTLHYK